MYLQEFVRTAGSGKNGSLKGIDRCDHYCSESQSQSQSLSQSCAAASLQPIGVRPWPWRCADDKRTAHARQTILSGLAGAVRQGKRAVNVTLWN
jgi:hypothetical protein